jgi:hypothetical protein
MLATVGGKGRQIFQEKITFHLSGERISQAVKIAWNEEFMKAIE